MPGQFQLRRSYSRGNGMSQSTIFRNVWLAKRLRHPLNKLKLGKGSWENKMDQHFFLWLLEIHLRATKKCKYGIEKLIRIVHLLLNKSLLNEILSRDWNQNVPCPICKKGVDIHDLIVVERTHRLINRLIFIKLRLPCLEYLFRYLG